MHIFQWNIIACAFLDSIDLRWNQCLHIISHPCHAGCKKVRLEGTRLNGNCKFWFQYDQCVLLISRYIAYFSEMIFILFSVSVNCCIVRKNRLLPRLAVTILSSIGIKTCLNSKKNIRNNSELNSPLSNNNRLEEKPQNYASLVLLKY